MSLLAGLVLALPGLASDAARSAASTADSPLRLWYRAPAKTGLRKSVV